MSRIIWIVTAIKILNKVKTRSIYRSHRIIKVYESVTTDLDTQNEEILTYRT